MKLFGYLLFSGIMVLLSSGHTVTSYVVNESNGYERTELTLNAPQGSFNLLPVENSAPLKINGEYNASKYKPHFREKMRKGINEVRFDITQKDGKINEDGSVQYSFRMFTSADEENENKWQVYLSRQKPIGMNMQFGFGSSSINLSGMQIQGLDLKTGSADIDLICNLNQPNKSQIDTCKVQVSMGSLYMRNFDHLRIRNFVADVGFGKLSIDFSANSKQHTVFKTSVGAGNLNIKLPENNTPLLIKVKSSMMGTVTLPPGLTRKDKNTWINEHYYVNAPNALEFDLTVSVGSIVIK